jgi:hypothetical protein
VSVIRKAQKIHSKSKCYVSVFRVVITEKGVGEKKLIYKLYYNK